MSAVKVLKRMDTWVILGIALIFVGNAFLGSDQNQIALLFRGSSAQEFAPDRAKAGWFVVLFMVCVVTYAGARHLLADNQQAYQDHVQARAKQLKKDEEDKRQADLAKVREEIRAAEERGQAALQDTFRELRAVSDDVRLVHDEKDFRLVQAISERRDVPLSHTEIRTVVDDAYGNKKAVVVFHLFEGTGSWEFDRSNEFVPRNVIELLSKNPEFVTLGTYDFVIGVGLASNSPRQPSDQADRRARFLCAALSTFDGLGSGGRTFGLAIGEHEGPEIDTSKSQHPEQRPVVIVGVEEISDVYDQQELILRIMTRVEYAGVDLRKYRGLQRGETPTWYNVTQCRGPG